MDRLARRDEPEKRQRTMTSRTTAISTRALQAYRIWSSRSHCYHQRLNKQAVGRNASTPLLLSSRRAHELNPRKTAAGSACGLVGRRRRIRESSRQLLILVIFPGRAASAMSMLMERPLLISVLSLGRAAAAMERLVSTCRGWRKWRRRGWMQMGMLRWVMSDVLCA